MSDAPELDIPDDPREVVTFDDNVTIANRQSVYETIIVDVPKTVDSWKTSLFSYEWMVKDTFKSVEQLSSKDRERRLEIEQRIRDKKPLQTPILGMGVLDNVEIGAERAVFLTLAIHGAKKMPVHIPVSQRDFFKKFEA